jgi:serine/threonine-protein kinase
MHAMAYQPFEGGVMIWDGAPSPTIYVGLSASGDWVNRADQFQEGDPESDATLTPPAGRLQPVRGFGRLWREDESVRQALGWALAAEVGFEGTWQVFEDGYGLGSAEGRWWLFYFEGAPRWEEVAR